MRPIIKNKRGGFTDIFIFMIIAFALVLISGIFLYVTNTAKTEIGEKIDAMDLAGDGNNNASVVFENTVGKTVLSFDALRWISIFLIFGMILGIFVGSYMVTTKPIFFLPYIFIVIVAVVIAVGLSNAYETLASDPTLSATFLGFTGSNWILLKLPIIVSIVGIVGGIIMFARMGKREETSYYGY